MRALQRKVAAGKVLRSQVEARCQSVLAREHLHVFVDVEIGGSERAPTLTFEVNANKRRALERTRLGRRVLCTDQHGWSTERLVHAFRGQWKVEELFRRSKKGGVAPWAPSWQWNDASLRLHTFCTVLGLTLVSLVRVRCGPEQSALAMMEQLQQIQATELQVHDGQAGRPAVCLVPPVLNEKEKELVEEFALERWLPGLSSTREEKAARADKKAAKATSRAAAPRK